MVTDMKHIKLIRIIQAFSLALIATCSNAAFAYGPNDCLNDVVDIDSTMPVGLGTKLCHAAWTDAPANCYGAVSIYDESIPRFIAIDLCAGSTDAVRTLTCYKEVGERGLNRGLATTLCGENKHDHD